ncbi:hypothetical protein G6011_11383 [Alternaria panax]|uniref:Uncharacterized protein n=1 Tax=Alternaria panax TaxID=48097 RepID=A0AAD4IDP8_9PLEO|nr:hypothetical protein G6011_11383 [Alternaria panax]
MQLIAEKHAAFISRLTKLLDLFVAMRCVSPSDVIRPPHSSETVATSIFEKIGLDVDVIELIKLIPAMRSDIVEGYQWFGVELIPHSKAVTCFANSDISGFIEDLRWGERYNRDGDTKPLPPWMLSLTSGSTCSGQYGADLIYDTHDRTIIQWPSVGPEGNQWEKSPRRPVGTVLDEIITKFQNLEWVPYYDRRDEDEGDDPPARRILEDPNVMQNTFAEGIRLPYDTTAAIQYMKQQGSSDGADELRRSINHFRSWQKIYRDCAWGWGSLTAKHLSRKE